MPDIRLARPRNSRIWLWTGGIAVLALALWFASTFFLGDATTHAASKKVGAGANFGGERGDVLPLRTESFESALPLEDRELGRLLHLRGVAESPLRRQSVWVRTDTGRRILLRFEPAPPEGALRVGPGSPVSVAGYVRRIPRAEFEAWVRDTLGVVLPRPVPGRKFGDVPDSSFARVDSLFIKDYYLSVRPEGLDGVVEAQAETAAPAPAASGAEAAP